MESNGNKHQKNSLILALLAIIFFGLYMAERMNISLGFLTSAEQKFVNSADHQLDSIAEQLKIRMIEIKKLGGKVNELETARIEIEKDRKKIQEGSDALDVNELKKKLAFYVRLLSQKDQEIKKLKRENIVLIARNDSLSREAQLLKEGLSSIQKALKDSSFQFDVKQRALSERSRFLEAKNQELSEKVSVAAAMHAEGVNVYAISSRGKESGIHNQKAKRIEKIRVIFHLQENALTAKELKTVYLRIIEPTGIVISDYASGSGTFMFKNKEMAYTAKQRIFYENNHQSVEFIYARNGAYKEGRHEIEIYAEGFLIGLGSFEVK